MEALWYQMSTYRNWKVAVWPYYLPLHLLSLDSSCLILMPSTRCVVFHVYTYNTVDYWGAEVSQPSWATAQFYEDELCAFYEDELCAFLNIIYENVRHDSIHYHAHSHSPTMHSIDLVHICQHGILDPVSTIYMLELKYNVTVCIASITHTCNWPVDMTR